MTYQVKLQVFEGPLDLLLYLIKKSEVDIYNIPIADITQQYIEYLQLIETLDLHIAGDFLVMAATLMQIKSRMLLPIEERSADEAEEEDPREELVRRLLEYQRFKEVARHLAALAERRKQVFVRTPDPIKVLDGVPPSDEPLLIEASVFDLLSAFSKVLIRVPRDETYEIIQDEVTVEEQMGHLRRQLRAQQHMVFHELFVGAQTRVQVSTTFLALLELVRLKEIRAQQDAAFGTITLVRRDEVPAAVMGMTDERITQA
jgi:segregation and condensation protein A